MLSRTLRKIVGSAVASLALWGATNAEAQHTLRLGLANERFAAGNTYEASLMLLTGPTTVSSVGLELRVNHNAVLAGNRSYVNSSAFQVAGSDSTTTSYKVNLVSFSTLNFPANSFIELGKFRFSVSNSSILNQNDGLGFDLVDVIVLDGGGQPYTLSTVPAPGNFYFANGFPANPLPTNQIGRQTLLTQSPTSSQNLCQGAGFTFSATSFGTNSPSVTLQRWDGATWVTATPANGSAVITGPTTTATTLPQTVNATNATFSTTYSTSVPAYSVNYSFTNLSNTNSGLYRLSLGDSQNASVTGITTNTFTINIANQPAVSSVTPSSVVTCAGQSVTFQANATGDNLQYQWGTLDGLSQFVPLTGQNSSTLTLSNVAASQQVVVRVSSACFPIPTTAVASLTVNTPPSISSQPTPNTNLCVPVGGTVPAVLTASSADGSSTISWQYSTNNTTWTTLGNGVQLNGLNISGATTNTLTVVAGSGNVGVHFFRTVFANNCGVATTNVAQVNVNSTPQITGVTTNQANNTSCFGASFNVTASANTSAGSQVSYSWSGPGAIANGSSLTPTITPIGAGTFVYTMTVISTNNGTTCSNSTTLTLTVNRPFVTTINGNATPVPVSYCQNASQTLTAAVGTTATTTYVWTRVSDNAVVGNAATFTVPTNVATTQTYRVTATVIENSLSCSSSAQITVTVNATSTVAISGPTAICQNGAATLTAAATGVGTLTYAWRNSASALVGSASTYAPPTNIAGSTTYTLTVTATDALGTACVVSSSFTIAVNATPQLTVVAGTSQSVCQNGTLNVTVNPTAGSAPFQYFWSIGAGAFASGSSTQSVVTSAAGAQVYRVYAVDANGCSTATSTINVTVNPTPTVTVQAPTTATCLNNALTVTANPGVGTAPFTYTWRNSSTNTVVGSAQAFSVPTNAFGTTTYNVVMTDANNCVSAAANYTVTVWDRPTVSAVAPAPANRTVCFGGSLNLTATAAAGVNSSAALTYTWTVRSGSTVVASFTNTSNAYNFVGNLTPGTYNADVVVTDGNGCSSSAFPFTVTIFNPPAPTIVGPTQVCANANNNYVLSTSATSVNSVFTLTFSAPGIATVVNGTQLTATQWQVNGTNATIRWTATGSFNVVEQTANGCVSLPTNNFPVVFFNLPQITQQPTAQAVCQGQTVTLGVIATGDGLTYQWFRSVSGNINDPSNTLITGATSPVYSFSAAFAQQGYYYVRVSNICNQPQFSTPTFIRVFLPPTITAQPVDQNVCAGSDVTFTVQATGDGLTYQWLYAGQPIVGQNASTLVLTGVTPANTGNYSVVVTGTCAPAVTSVAAALTVRTAPVIVSSPVSVTTCENGSFALNVTATNTTGTPMTYQWQRLVGTTWTNINGAVAPTYAVNNTVALSDAGSYRVVVSGTCPPSTTSSVAVVTVNELARLSSVTTNFATDGGVCLNGNAQFTATATGTGLTYQWFFRAIGQSTFTALPGQTASVLNVSAINANSGSYQVQVSGVCGNIVTSTPIVLTVFQPVAITFQPASQNVCIGNNITLLTQATGTGVLVGTNRVLQYQWKKDGQNINGANSAQLVLNNVGFSVSGNYTCVITGQCGSVETSVAVVNVNPILTRINVTPINQTVVAGDRVQISVNTALTPAATFQWYRGAVNPVPVVDDGRISGAKSSVLTIDRVNNSDVGNDYFVVVNDLCGVNVSSEFASINLLDPRVQITAQPQSQTICAGGNATLSVAVTSNVPNAVFTYEWTKVGNPAVVGRASSLVFNNATTADAGTYVVTIKEILSGAVSTSANAVLTVKTAPVVTTQPANASACENQGVTLETRLDANQGPYTYQWFFNGQAQAGNTAATLTITQVNAQTAGNYNCVISNECGTVSTATAVVSVKPQTRITTQPVPTPNLNNGGTLNLSVANDGSNCNYQWEIRQSTGGWRVITGATSATFTKSNVTLANDGGLYRVIVNCDCGTVTSETIVQAINGTGVNDLPMTGDRLALAQNTPNPFGNETQIRYFVPNSTVVRLVVTDMFGREIAVLVDGLVTAGENTVTFDISNLALSSGTYFYSVSANGQTETKRMSIVK